MDVLANVAIPTVAGHIIIMLILLVPVALIEAIVLSLRHSVKYLESFHLSLRANLRSTLVGLPMGYVFALAGVIPAGLFSMLLPKKINSVIGVILGNVIINGGTIPNKLDEIGFFLGILLVMIPYFFVTLRIERKSIAKNRNDLDGQKLKVTVRIMNEITYGLLLIPVLFGTVMAAMKLMSKN